MRGNTFSRSACHHPQCNQEYKEGRVDLLRWGLAMMHDTRSIWQLGYLYLIDVFSRKPFHKEVMIGFRTYHQWAETPIEHPIPTRDKGVFYVDCKTNLSSLEPEEIANLVLNVSDLRLIILCNKFAEDYPF